MLLLFFMNQSSSLPVLSLSFLLYIKFATAKTCHPSPSQLSWVVLGLFSVTAVVPLAALVQIKTALEVTHPSLTAHIAITFLHSKGSFYHTYIFYTEARLKAFAGANVVVIEAPARA